MNEYPHDRMVEEALIGSVLVNAELMNEPDIARLQPNDFYILSNRYIWEAIRNLGSSVDIISVYDELGKLEYGSHVTSADITGIISRTPMTFHANEYASRILEYSMRRKDIDIARQIATQAFEGTVDRAHFIQLLADNQHVDGGAEHIQPFISTLVKAIEERAKNPRDIWGIPTGFPDLDKLIGGLQREQTLMLSAPPGVGKSILAMQIAHHVAKKGEGVAIYSFEMSAQRVLMRLISADSGVSTRNMNTGRMNGNWQEFYTSATEFDKLPMYISDIYGMTTSELRADLAKLCSKHNIGLVVVDYLNKLLDRDGGDDLSNTKLKAQRMQGICREFGVSAILIQSMNKEGMRATVPVMADMSGPADTAHEGDNVFLMGKHPEIENVVRLYPAKLR
jgi:replicative DNA helicase